MNTADTTPKALALGIWIHYPEGHRSGEAYLITARRSEVVRCIGYGAGLSQEVSTWEAISESGDGVRTVTELDHSALSPLTRYRLLDRPAASADEIAAIKAKWAQYRAKLTADREAEETARRALVRKGLELWPDLAPDLARYAIIAEQVRDDSDLMSDYHGSVRMRRVVIGFSASGRDNFREMRRAVDACTLEDVKHLGSLSGPEVEHREKYSMGHGYYLKAGHRHATGWEVRKTSCCQADGTPTDDICALIGAGSVALPAAAAVVAPVLTPAAAAGVTVTENEQRDGVEIRFPSKPAADVLDGLKRNGWRWSRFGCCWYHRRNPETLAYARALAGVAS